MQLDILKCMYKINNEVNTLQGVLYMCIEPAGSMQQLGMVNIICAERLLFHRYDYPCFTVVLDSTPTSTMIPITVETSTAFGM